MITLKVESGGKTYPVFIGINILDKLSEICQIYGYKSRAAVITDFKSDHRYFKMVIDNFKKTNIEIIPIYIGAQQPGNGLIPVQQIARRLVELQFQPNEAIISFGGSLIGNISAFVAQMIYGGVAYLQIPTTLTAQVVQSVDPRCRTNFGSALNWFSIRYERNIVWSDVALLKTLPQKNLTSGLGYIIQYACLQDNGLFGFLEKNLKKILNLNLDVIEETIFRCCQCRIDFLKKNFAEQQNQQQRAFGEFMASILIEFTQNRIKFGEALLFGMLIEGIISFRLGIFDEPYFERLYELLKQVPFYYFRTDVEQKRLIEYLTIRLSAHNPPLLQLPRQFGKFSALNTYKLSDILSVLELVFSS